MSWRDYVDAVSRFINVHKFKKQSFSKFLISS